MDQIYQKRAIASSRVKRQRGGGRKAWEDRREHEGRR